MLFLPFIHQRAGELRSGPLSCATCEAVVCPSPALRLGNYRALATGYGDCACQPFSSAAVLAARQLGAVRPGERHGQLGSTAPDWQRDFHLPDVNVAVGGQEGACSTRQPRAGCRSQIARRNGGQGEVEHPGEVSPLTNRTTG